MILVDIIIIAVLCIVFGAASIPLSFPINDNPFVVWAGNALGSLISAGIVIYIGNRITSEKFKKRASKYRIGNKITIAFDEADDSKKAQKVGSFVDKHGLRLFSLISPVFPGVLIATTIVYALGLNKKIYIHWMLAGVFIVSGAYVFNYWYFFVKT